jgi:hypothetical protein
VPAGGCRVDHGRGRQYCVARNLTRGNTFQRKYNVIRTLAFPYTYYKEWAYTHIWLFENPYWVWTYRLTGFWALGANQPYPRLRQRTATFRRVIPSVPAVPTERPLPAPDKKTPPAPLRRPLAGTQNRFPVPHGFR